MPLKRSPPNNNRTGRNGDINMAKRQHKELTPSPVSSINAKNSAEPTLMVGSLPVNDLKNLIQDSISNLLDEKLKNVATKSDIESMSTEILNLKECNKSLQAQLDNMQSRCLSLEQQVEMLDRKAKEQNIIVHMPKQNGVDAAQKAKSICLEMLRSNNAGIIKSVTELRSGGNVANVVVELHDKNDAIKVLRAKANIAGTGISMHKDYPVAARERRRKIVNIRNQIVAKNKELKPQLKGEKLLVNEKTFYYDKNNILTSDSDDGLTFLKQLIGDVIEVTYEPESNGGNTMEASCSDVTKARNQNCNF